MEVIVFSDTPAVQSCFAKVEKAKSFSVQYRSQADIKKICATASPSSVLYADISGLTAPALKKNLGVLAASCTVFGILDPKGACDDPALMFHSGASDYIGKALFKDGIDHARIKKVWEFGRDPLLDIKAEPETAIKYNVPLSGKDWKSVKAGSEYIFSFMHIEVDNQKAIRKRFPGTALEEFTKKFHDFVAKSVADINGRIWMWTDLGGLVLLPFDGENCPAIFKAFNMILNRRITSFEEFDYDMLISYHIAIHIGESVYHERGDTGKIVSDSVNSIHHLKQNYAEEGHMYLTEDAFRFIPRGFGEFFVKDGSYEGREIYRLRALL